MTDLDTIMRVLIRRGVVTIDPDDAELCCGMARDYDGFCIYRPGHPIYIPLDYDPCVHDNLVGSPSFEGYDYCVDCHIFMRARND